MTVRLVPSQQFLWLVVTSFSTCWDGISTCVSTSPPLSSSWMTRRSDDMTSVANNDDGLCPQGRLLVRTLCFTARQTACVRPSTFSQPTHQTVCQQIHRKIVGINDSLLSRLQSGRWDPGQSSRHTGPVILLFIYKYLLCRTRTKDTGVNNVVIPNPILQKVWYNKPCVPRSSSTEEV